MAVTAIDALAKAIDDGMVLPNGKWSMIPLRTKHDMEWDSILGWITKAETDENYNLWIEAELDPTNSTAVGLYKKLVEGDKPGKPLQLGLSVGGKIKKASYEWNHEFQKKVRIIEEVILKEVSVTSSPANPPTYIDVLAKSVNWEEILPPNEELVLQERTMDDLNKNDDPKDTEVVATLETDVEGNAAETATTESAAQAEPAAEEAATTTTEDTQEAEAEPAVDTAETVTPKTEPEAETPNEVTLESVVAQLQQFLNKDKGSETEVTKSEPSNEENSDLDLAKALGPDLDARIATAVANALTSFATEHLAPIAEQVKLVKSELDEISEQPLDKSSVKRQAKDGQDSYADDFRKRLSEVRGTNGTVNPIKAAVQASIDRTR
jgi:HK97 family phage prohead protease